MVGLGILVFGAIGVAYVIQGNAASLSSSLALAGVLVGGGGFLCYFAWGLVRRNERSRTPVVLTQLFALPVAYYLWQSGSSALGGALAGVAVIVLLLVLSPPSTAVLYPDTTRR